MEIKLTHQQKIALLEAVQCGMLDTSIFDVSEKENGTTKIEDIEREIIRLELNDYQGILLPLAELLRQYAMQEITREEYITKRIELIKHNQYGNNE